MNVLDELADLVAPLREKRDKIAAELEQIEKQRIELREAKSSIDAVLRRLDPSEEPYRKNGNRPGLKKGMRVGASDPALVARNAQLRREALLAYLDEHADELSDGFTASMLGRRMKDAGIHPDGKQPMSDGKVLALIRELHEEGVLRALHKVRGGATAYGLVR